MSKSIRSEMTANVWKINKLAGEPFREGECLIILESMKMEIPVEAPCDGVVEKMVVSEGGVVEEDGVLLTYN